MSNHFNVLDIDYSVSPTTTTKIRESVGPTDLSVGAVANGKYLKRVGTTVVGADAGAVADSGIFYIDVRLSNSQILNLKATPVQILPSPGPGKALIPAGQSWEIYDVTNAAYGLGAGGGAGPAAVGNMGTGEDAGIIISVWFQIDNASMVDSGTVVVSTHNEDTAVTFYPLSDNRASNFEDMALAIRNTGGVEYTGGDTANSVSLRIGYRVVDTIPFGA